MSNALDTNGQNARYVRAARRWGTDPDVLRALALGNADPAGVVTRYRQAAAKCGSGLVIREAHKASAYFDFPVDIIWDRRTEPEIRRLAEEADVIHLNNSDIAYRRFSLRKPALLHHHGSLFRSDPARWFKVANAFRMVQAVSTIDLTRPDPKSLHWLPTAYDLDELAEFGALNRREPDGRIRVVSAPTRRALKATAELIAAVKALQAEGLPIDLVLVENRTWRECLAEKAAADIVFDQVAFGYGCNAVEAWGMGVPVIAGADDWTLERMTKEWGALPFYVATAATIADAIRAMAQSADLRAEMTEAGRVHVERYHAEKPALVRLAELYEKAIRTYKRPASRSAVAAGSVTFRNTKARKIWVLERDDPIAFVDGLCTTDDPFEIETLRRFTRRPQYGIVEVTPETVA